MMQEHSHINGRHPPGGWGIRRLLEVIPAAHTMQVLLGLYSYQKSKTKKSLDKNVSFVIGFCNTVLHVASLFVMV